MIKYLLSVTADFTSAKAGVIKDMKLQFVESVPNPDKDTLKTSLQAMSRALHYLKGEVSMGDTVQIEVKTEKLYTRLSQIKHPGKTELEGIYFTVVNQMMELPVQYVFSKANRPYIENFKWLDSGVEGVESEGVTVESNSDPLMSVEEMLDSLDS